MKTAYAASLGLAAIVITACAPPHLRHGGWRAALHPVSQLQCPPDQDNLHLKTAAPDLKSCLYSGDDGAEVQLQLLQAPGDPGDVLGPIESQLKTLLPTPPATPAPVGTPARPGGPDRKQVDISLPGLSIHAGDQAANIRIGGLHINADSENDTVHLTGAGDPMRRGQFTIDANDNGAVIRGEGRGPDVSSSLILASDRPGPDGWRVVGYQARGPRSGPLVVATFKVKAAQDHEETFNAAKRLAERSARG